MASRNADGVDVREGQERARRLAADALRAQAARMREEALLLEQQATELAGLSLLPQRAQVQPEAADQGGAAERDPMRRMVADYIAASPKPPTRSEITKHVLRLKPTSTAEYVRTTINKAIARRMIVAHGDGQSRTFTLGPVKVP